MTEVSSSAVYATNAPRVSVVLPIWNPGPEISRCIASLRNQTLEDIEMIFVNDCSTDNSMDIARAAAEDDSRIRIIENESNIGPGPSRNRGIEAARGEYLSFVDPDDYIAPDFLELLYREAFAQKADIVKGTLASVKADGTAGAPRRNMNRGIRRGQKAQKPLYMSFYSEHQSAVYRRDFILAQMVRYGTSRKAEDHTFLLAACFKAQSISFADDALYYYCEHPGSITHTPNAENLHGTVRAIRERIDFILREMPGDAWAPEYLQTKFHFALRETLRYRTDPAAEELLAKYTSDLGVEFGRLPFNEAMAERSYSLRCLQNHGICLPREPYYSAWEGRYPPVRYAMLAGQWIDHYLGHPDESEACWKDLRDLIGRAYKAVGGKPQNTYSQEERREGAKLLDKQVARLPLKLRLQVWALRARSADANTVPKRIMAIAKFLGIISGQKGARHKQ